MPDTFNLPDEALTKAVEIIGEHTGETYDNLIQPASKETGFTLESIIKIVSTPLKYLSAIEEAIFAHKLQKYKSELDKKLGEIPEEKRIEPDLHTILEAIEQSRFCITDDELRAMFVNLIAGALNSDTSKNVHPAFAAIIRQMSSYDAKIIQKFKDKHTIKLDPVEDVLSEFDATQLDISLCNLERLGLVRIPSGINWNDIRVLQSTLDEYEKFHFSTKHEKRQCAELTGLGEQFVYICC